MKPGHAFSSLALVRRLLAFGLLAVLSLPLRSQTPVGSLAGTVNNTATGVFLKDALVELPDLGRQTLTDGVGAFRFVDVPVGTHALVVTYLGLDAIRQTITVEAGQRTSLALAMGTTVYTLGEFVITGEREGNAASITRQRNAANVKNVVSLDAFGNLPNDSAGELLMRLPGIAGNLDDEGNVTGVSIRGTAAGLNTVSIDGNRQASAGGFGRDFRTHNISGALFDEIEVSKAPTPDMPADSLGGAVNLKTRSPLNMKERRRLNYRAGARWAAPFFTHTPLRTEHAIHPLLSFGYQEVFDVLGETRNLGVSLNLFYSENVNSVDQTLLDYQNTTASPAYIWDYRRQNAYNNRTQRSATLKLDYKVSDRTRIFLNTIWNDAPEKFNRLYTMRAFSSQAIAAIGSNGQPTGTNPILPGFTSNRTEVRPVANAVVQLNSTLFSFLDNQRQVHGGVVHEFDRLKIDYDANYNHSKPLLQSSYRDGNAGGGVFTMEARSVGWTFDKSQSAANPAFGQTGGPSIFDVANYTNGLLNNRNNKRFTTLVNASANATYTLPTSFASTIKTGVRYIGSRIEEVGGDRRWNYIGTGNLGAFVNRGLELSYADEVGGNLPFVESSAVAADIRNNPQNWREDLYYATERTYVGTRSLEEKVTAAYLQGNARLGRLSVLAGVRAERTEVSTDGYLPARVRTTTAERTADPVGSANKDYSGGRTLREGDYTDVYPGVHLVYKFTPSLQSRVSWSNSIGRPPGGDLLPSLTFNDTAQTVRSSNPALKPQYAENWDVTLEYYFEPVGQLSFGVFRKDISDFLVDVSGGTIGAGSNNGFNGEFAGYELRSPGNGGFARIEGWEFNYQQQFSFLPGIWRGLGLGVNYTKLTTEGDYGEVGPRSTPNVARFVPETGNVRLTYSYRKFGFNALYNYVGPTLWDYSATAARLRYRDARETVNLGFTYRHRPSLTVFVDAANVFNTPQEYYRGVTDRTERVTFNGTALVFGISGAF
jgi:iron complex outermembrane receptor protein